MSEKIVGYALLFLGLLLILITLISGYNLFTKATQPIQFFKFDEIAITIPNSVETSGTQLDLSQKITLPNTIEGPLNMATHLFFLSFFVSVGAKIASVGTQLIRPIVVKAKSEEKKSNPIATG